MRKLTIMCVTFFVLCVFASSVSALSLRMTFNGEDPPHLWYTCLGNKVKVDIYLEGWDVSWFSTEPLLGIQLFLYYEKYHTEINLENSYPASSFDSSLSFAQALDGRVKLVAASSGCINMSGSMLIWTVEIEPILRGWKNLTVQMDYPGDGLVVPGGPYCSAPHQLGATSVTEHLYAEYEDLNGNGCVDYCECEADFDNDGAVSSADVTVFLNDFGRSRYNNPCTNLNPCNGDFYCNGSVDAHDVSIFLEDFGRNMYSNPCPQGCYTNPWCNY